MAGFYDNTYNPDVLLCLANLSNDEVFTPPDVANQILDMLPQELFSDPNTKFLDPACKSGVFLREIAKRLIVGLANTIPNLQERIDHIMHKQLYAIAITELTAMLSRRSVYCSKYPNGPFAVSHFETAQGNIKFHKISHVWRDGRCVYCGASQGELDRDKDMESHAYEFIHTLKPEEIFNMKFDVIVSNPPYQTYTNTQERAAAKQARPLFHEFVEQAKKLNPRYMAMIIPARWYSGGIGLQDFREKMTNDAHITKLVDFINSKDCFDGVDIAGGICYFLWDRDNIGPCEVTNISGSNITKASRMLNEFGDIFIRTNIAIPIIKKVQSQTTAFLTDQVFSLDPFGFPTSARGKEEPFEGAIALIHSKGNGYVSRADVSKNKELIDKWKVTIARVVPGNGEVGVDPEKGYKAITNPRILNPGEVNTFSYMLLGAFDTKQEAENFRAYMMCKFPRFLLRLTYSSMNIAKSNFMFVPKMDFTHTWTDEELYKLYGLSSEEISLVEKTIRPFSGGDT